MSLNTDFNLGPDSDSLFNDVLAAHEGLSREQLNS